MLNVPSLKSLVKSEDGEEGAHNLANHLNSPPGSRRNSEKSQGPGLLEMVAGDEPEEGDDEERLTQRSSSIIKFYPEWCSCCKKNTPFKPLSKDAPFIDHTKDFFDCPPKGAFGRLLLFILICLCLWGLLLNLLLPLSKQKPHEGQHEVEYDINTNPAWVYGPLFALGIIEITGLISGILLKRFLNLPPLLGPLILGIIYNNVPAINVFWMMRDFDHRDESNHDEAYLKEAKHSVTNWVKPIRVIALGIILTRAGLELSPKQLRKLKGVVPMLAFGPCIVEALTCALFSYIFFNILSEDPDKKMEIAMCFVGGFALAAVSPAVVVPGALSLKKSGYGVVKGVPTLLIAASSIDDVLAISIYTIALGFAIKREEITEVVTEGIIGNMTTTENSTSPGSIPTMKTMISMHDNPERWKTYSGGIIGITVGIIHGLVLGMILHFIPTRNSKYKAENRLTLLLLINFTSVLAYEETFFNGAGSISVLVTSLIAGFGWRSQAHWKRPMKKVEKALAHMWVLWVPLIFGTIGKEIDFTSNIFKSVAIAKIFGIIGICIVARCLTAFLVAGFGTGYNTKERLFIALSWIPKATVQAALAPLVLTRAAEADQNTRDNAEVVVNLAIIAVLITAPVGCVLIAMTAPKLLEHNSSPEIIEAVEEEFPNGGGLDPAESTFEMIIADRRKSLKADPEAAVPAQGSKPETEAPRRKSISGAQSAKTVT